MLAVLITITCSFSLVSCSNSDENTQNSADKYTSNNDKETEATTSKPKIKVSIPVSKKSARKMDYMKLVKKLSDAGFSDIDCTGAYDLKTSKSKKNNKVATIDIDGMRKFKKGKKVLSDVPIDIKYHSVRCAEPPVNNYDIEYDEVDYEDVITQYEKAGFNNIKTKKLENDSKTEGTVKKISIDGKTSYFTSFPVDAKVLITYYTKTLKKATQKSSSKKSSKGNTNFKKLIDDYEKFIDDYVAFMKKYQNSNDTAGMLSDYTKWMSDYAKWVDKIDDIDEDSLSSADLAYYTKVMARIDKKLLEVT